MVGSEGVASCGDWVIQHLKEKERVPRDLKKGKIVSFYKRKVIVRTIEISVS